MRSGDACCSGGDLFSCTAESARAHGHKLAHGRTVARLRGGRECAPRACTGRVFFRTQAVERLTASAADFRPQSFSRSSTVADFRPQLLSVRHHSRRPFACRGPTGVPSGDQALAALSDSSSAAKKSVLCSLSVRPHRPRTASISSSTGTVTSYRPLLIRQTPSSAFSR